MFEDLSNLANEIGGLIVYLKVFLVIASAYLVTATIRKIGEK